jgi:hypothetical protein
MSINVKTLMDFAAENDTMYCEIQMNDYMGTLLKVTYEKEEFEDYDEPCITAGIYYSDSTSYTGWREVASGDSMEDIKGELLRIALFDGEITALEVEEI